ncbi:MAG: 50S ribosomal protein L10 [Candidatus Aenigmatarchaeota archaeon]|nr:50S ribosomal protein L10 [Candidatus Aenigmarchaeota archaeon]
MTTEKKEKELNELKNLLRNYKVIGVVNMMKMPTREMQLIKKSLGDKALIKVSKKTLVEIAMKETGKDLVKYLSKQPALVFTNMDVFEFFKEVNGMKFKTYAKEGYVVNEDVVVQPGPTDLLPGPAISELHKVGIVAGVEGGKIAVKKQSTILKKGQEVTKEIASVLRKLKMKIADIKLNVEMLFDGTIYPKETLELVEVYLQKLKEAFNQALNLSIAINYPTKENIKYLLTKAYQRGKALEKRVGG